ncbi:MAG TPA: hypothetical protein VGH50_07725 [Candidatus Binatia bacterium]|jgi:predicted ATP-grasp superfamily ATP-dependent carboligase
MSLDAFADRRGSLPAVVLGGGHNALGVFRSLGRKGIKVIAVHAKKRDAASRSKFCSPVTVPYDPAVESERYADFLLQLPAPATSCALIPTGDAEVFAASRQRERLQKRYRYIMPPHDVVEALIDKRLFAKLAQRYGMLTPRSYEIDSDGDIAAAAREIAYPCVIKPAISRAWSNADFQRRFGNLQGGWIKRLVIGSRAEFVDLYPQVAAFESRLVVQEYIEGGDDALYDFYSYVDENSEPLGCFMLQKIRTLPIDGNGIGTCVKSVWDEALAQSALGFLKAIGYRGNSAVCFKRCARSGRFYLIEVNARLALHHSLAEYCGVDLSYMAYLDAAGIRPPAASPARRNVLWLSFWDDLAAFRRYRRRGDLSFRAWIASLKGEKTHCFFAADDLRPSALKTAEALLVEIFGRDRMRKLLRAARRCAVAAYYYSRMARTLIHHKSRHKSSAA